MNQGLIPRRYAKALYKFALEKGKQLRVYALMSKLEESYRLEPELQKVMSIPLSRLRTSASSYARRPI